MAAHPGLQILPMPGAARLTEEQIAAIDIAVFSNDLVTSGQARAFFGVVLRAPSLRWLHAFAAGLDDPVFDALADRGVALTHSAGASATPIAHTVMMHLVALCRHARPLAVAQSEQRWARPPDGNLDVEGRTLGVVGLGSIGAEVARLAGHFGMHIIGVRRHPDGSEPCETWPVGRLHELLPRLDDLVLTAPLTAATRGMIGAAELALLPAGAHVVNVGRGELVDEAALAAALATGHLGGAALDVFATEPLPADSPLWALPNVIITPHSAAGTPLGSDRAAAVCTANLARWARGEPLQNLRW